MLALIRKLITINPMGVFIYGILGKLYLTIAVAGLVVTFWVFKGLEQAGVLTTFRTTMTRAIVESKAVAKSCIPRIFSIHDFIDCIQNIPEYVPEQDEIELNSKVNDLLRNNFDNKSNVNDDPYYDGEN
ncbi:MAG: DUF2670 domain-containing protein [Janthinobacterium lividum]